MIDRLTEERIKQAAHIVDICQDFLDDIRKSGVEFTARCPFHEDRHAGNFKISPKKNIAKCFSCGWSGDPIQFLMDYGKGMTYNEALMYLAKKYDIPCEDAAGYDYKPPTPVPAPPPLPTLELPHTMMASRERLDDDTLIQWIRRQPWDYVAAKRVGEMLKAYHIGHARNGMTIFWQIDEQGKVRTGKMMRYKSDGHRDKETRYNFDWIHSSLARRRKIYDGNGEVTGEGPLPFPDIYDPDKQECRPCYFGLHLLDAYGKEATVCLVESEKTALLMAIQYGNHAKQVWMACGGLENLSREKMMPIINRRRRVVLYPDRDGIEKWKMKAEQLHYDRLTIVTTPVTQWWRPEDGEKADIADVVMRFVQNSKPIKTIGDVIENMPKAKQLIETFNLEVQHGNE